MGMSTEAQTGPLNRLGMGGAWEAHGKLPGHGRGMGGPWAHSPGHGRGMGGLHFGSPVSLSVGISHVRPWAGMCTRVAHGVSVTLFLPDWCDQTDRTEACMGRWQLLIAWAWETVGMEKSLDVTDGSVVRAWDCCACSSVSSASDDCARRLLHCVALSRPCRLRARTGRSRLHWTDCALVCVLRIGRLRARLRSAHWTTARMSALCAFCI